MFQKTDLKWKTEIYAEALDMLIWVGEQTACEQRLSTGDAVQYS